MNFRADQISATGMFVRDPLPGPPLCKCSAPATHWLEIHYVDYCTSQRPTLGSFLCDDCMGRDLERARLIAADGAEWCSSCGLTIDSLCAIIVRQCPLEG